MLNIQRQRSLRDGGGLSTYEEDVQQSLRISAGRRPHALCHVLDAQPAGPDLPQRNLVAEQRGLDAQLRAVAKALLGSSCGPLQWPEEQALEGEAALLQQPAALV